MTLVVPTNSSEQEGLPQILEAAAGPAVRAGAGEAPTLVRPPIIRPPIVIGPPVDDPPPVVLPYVFFRSPQPGQIFPSNGAVQISVDISQAQRLDFRARQVGGFGTVFLRSFGPTPAGTVDFSVPASQIPFTNAAIQLDFYASATGNPFQAFSGQFLIQAGQGGAAAFTSPAGGEVWSCNQPQFVTWTFGGQAQRFEIAYSLNGGFFQTVNNYLSGDERSYFFFPPFVFTNTSTRLRLRTVGTDGLATDTISNPFTLANF